MTIIIHILNGSAIFGTIHQCYHGAVEQIILSAYIAGATLSRVNAMISCQVKSS